MDLIREGGWPMWFTLIFGLLSLASAARFARSADRRHLGFVIGISTATLFSIFNGFAADLAAVGNSVARGYPDNETYLRVINKGFAESMSPGILGFTLLSLTWLVAAVGLGRAARAQG
jgi:Na+/H+ antiporter NhaC